MKTRLIIPAAGMGRRLGAAIPKALIDVAGRPLLARSLDRFLPFGLMEDAVIVTPPGWRAPFETMLASLYPEAGFTLVDGGDERQWSVYNALTAIDPQTDIVLIHDAARPFVTQESVTAVIEAAETHGAASVAIPSVDTIFVADHDRFLQDTPDRSRLWACQTPQAFVTGLIRDAHEKALREHYTGTDDASLVKWMGGQVKLVMGSRLNFKVTTAGDVTLAALVIREGLA